MVHRWLRLATLSRYVIASPAVVAQGVWIKKTIERLPEATGASGVFGDGQIDLHVASVGDSLAAGVGVQHHHETVVGFLAQKLAEQRPESTVHWQVQAQSGLTAGGLHDLLDYQRLAECEVIVVSIGANDTKNLHSAERWRNELRTLMSALRDAAPLATIVLLGVPPMACFPALPWPLSATLGARAAFFESIAEDVCSRFDRVRRVRLLPEQVVGMFASDGFHPGGKIHELLAEAIADELSELQTMATGS